MTTPAGQRWTREKPTEPGWYWFRHDIGWTAYVFSIYKQQGRLFVELPDKVKPLSMVDGEWQGPLTPNEATT